MLRDRDDLRARAEAGLSQFKAFGKRWDVALLAAMLVAMLVVRGTGAGDDLDRKQFVSIAIRMRQAVGCAPKLPPNVRVFLQEDRSLERLRTPLSFAEWYEVGATLLQQGFERVVLLGVHEATGDAVARRHDSGTFSAGAATIASAANLRAVESAAVRDGALLAVGVDRPAFVEFAPYVLGPVIVGADVLDRIGGINASSPLAVHTLAPVGPRLALPPLGLLGAKAMRIEAQSLAVTDDEGREHILPPELYVDYLESKSIAAASLPITALFDPKSRAPLASWGPKTMQRLAGGKVAVLVPDAYTGSRFVESPLGPLLGHYAVLGVLADALTGEYLVHVQYDLALIALASVAFWRALCLTRPRQAYLVAIGVAVTWCAIAAYCFLRASIVLPCFSVLVLAAFGFGARGVQHFLATFRAKIVLSNELAMGKSVQKTLLPESLTGTVGYWEYQIFYHPFGSLAGDWAQIFADPAGRRLVIAIGDVVGKGASAALATTVAASVFRVSAQDWAVGTISLEQLVERLDQSIRLAFRETQFTTLQVIAVENDEVRFARFGAPPWLLRDSSVMPFRNARSQAGDPLGMALSSGRSTKLGKIWSHVAAGPGAMFVACTDGVVDGATAVGDAVRALNAGTADGRAPSFAEVYAVIDRAGSGSRLADDKTLVVLRRAMAEERSVLDPVSAKTVGA